MTQPHASTGFHADAVSLQRGRQPVLTDVDFRLAPGEMVGLLGANGAGKSSLMALLSGELHAGSGSLTLDGQAIQALPAREQARRRAVMTQQTSLTFTLSARDIVGMGAYPFPELAPAEVERLMQTALASVHASHLIERSYSGLSGGEQQRVQFARAMVQCLAAPASHGRYLLLDEPTANLDPRHQIDLLANARRLAHEHGVGVLAILHDPTLAARWCDRLALLAGGRIVADGEPARVLTPALLRTVYDTDADVLPHPVEPGRVLVLFH